MKNKNATSANQSSILTQQVKYTKIRPPFKIELCIEELLYRSEKGMIELEALQAYGETCLHTTISTLANKHGLLIHRKSEPHKHRRGGTTHFTRYTLIDDRSVFKAQSLLKHYSKLRCVLKEAA